MPRRAHQYGEHDGNLPPEGDVVVGEAIMPSDAEDLSDVIDRRFKALLTMTTEPKDLTKALEAAAKWVEIKGAVKPAEPWGDKLRGGTTHNG